jgi:hypothetical protein
MAWNRPCRVRKPTPLGHFEKPRRAPNARNVSIELRRPSALVQERIRIKRQLRDLESSCSGPSEDYAIAIPGQVRAFGRAESIERDIGGKPK